MPVQSPSNSSLSFQDTPISDHRGLGPGQISGLLKAGFVTTAIIIIVVFVLAKTECPCFCLRWTASKIRGLKRGSREGDVELAQAGS